jgi:L-threonylcarbamoyladenylate synthase
MQAYSNNLLHKIQRHIKNGGIIAYPTEFCYGFGCDPFNYRAINNILRIKQRDKAKGLIVIAANIHQLDKLIIPISLHDRQKLKKYWPGFFSILLPSKKNTLNVLIGAHNKLAVRISNHDLVKQLCNYLHMPLVSTSANLSGHKPIKCYRECVRQFGKKVMVLPGNTGFAKNPSTIIDWKSGQIIR